MYAEFKFEMEEVRDIVESDAYPFSTVFAWFNSGATKANRKLHILKGEYSQALVAGATAFAYELPEDIIDQLIDEDGVNLYYSATERARPTLIGDDLARRIYGDRSNPNGMTGVQHYWFDDVIPGQILIGWPPQRSGTLIQTYTRVPSPIDAGNAIYAGEDFGVTAAIENGSTTVTFSNVVDKTKVMLEGSTARFELGLGSREVLPAKWRRLSGVTVDGNGDITSATLSSAFELAEVEAADFILAHVPEFIRAAPSEELTMLPVEWAWHMAYRKGDPESSKASLERFQNMLIDAAPNRRALSIPHRTPVRGSR